MARFIRGTRSILQIYYLWRIVMIKYGTGLPIDVPSKYKWYVDLETNIMYFRNGNLWEVYSTEGIEE